MNYSRKGMRRRRRELSSVGTTAKHKISAFLLLFIMILIIGGGYIGGMYVYGQVQDILAETPDISEIDATPSGYMSSVLDADGNVTAQLVAAGSNRVYVTIDEIPLNLQHAFVAIEDERFYEHNGIDLKGIIRAAFKGVANGFSFHEGASTITQQLLKNNVFDGWTSETKKQRIERKLQEQYLAIQLEKEESKDWILENYLNTINLGQNTLGVESASQRYFGKEVSELNLSECATIAAITQNPSKYNPITNPDENNKRRVTVLKNMRDQGYITEDECEEAIADDVYARIQDVNTEIENDNTNITSYFVDALTEQVVEDLQTELGYSEAQALKALYTGGITIYSTQDPDVQAICDEQLNDDENYSSIDSSYSMSYALSVQQDDGTVENYNEQTLLSYYKELYGAYNLNYDTEEAVQAAVDTYREAVLAEGGTAIGENLVITRQPQASCTVIDQKTGYVLALVGGRGEKTASLTLNRATDTLRQPGSTFKILSTYAPALDSGEYTLATSVEDEEVTYSSGQVVGNADGKYRGAVSIREAIMNSINTVAIKTIMDITPEVGYEELIKFGFSTITEDDIVEAMPLGVASVTNLELAAAYAAVANGGTYIEPTLYTKVLDHDGNVLLEKKQETHEVIEESTAYLLTSAMEDVVKSGSGKLAWFDGMSIAGKTGTAGSKEAARDSWFAGFSPYYTCVIWGGYDDNSELESRNFTKILWKATMQELSQGQEDIGFQKPDDVVQCTVCSESGLLASSNCTSTITEYFAKGTVPTKHCSAHYKVKICTVSGKLAGQYCPEDCVEEQSFSKDDVPTETCDVHTTPTDTTEEIGDPGDPTDTAATGQTGTGTAQTGQTGTGTAQTGTGTAAEN